MNVATWALGPAGGDGGPRRPEDAATAPVGSGVRAAAAAAGASLLAAGALHVVWIFSPWPLDSPAELAATVVGVQESQLPSRPLTLAVASLLGAASWLVVTSARSAHRLASARLVRVGIWTVCGVLSARGLGGLTVSGFALREATAEFRHWDLLLYSPLCIGIGGLTGYVATRTRRRRIGLPNRA